MLIQIKVYWRQRYDTCMSTFTNSRATTGQIRGSGFVIADDCSVVIKTAQLMYERLDGERSFCTNDNSFNNITFLTAPLVAGLFNSYSNDNVADVKQFAS